MDRGKRIRALVPATPVTPTRSRSPSLREGRESLSNDSKVLHSLNLRLQNKNHSLENENSRLKEEIQGMKGKTYIYESLTKDLASLRTQLDKTALALLKKCEAYDAVKKELTTLKSQYSGSSTKRSTPKRTNQRKLSIYQEFLNLDEEGILTKKSGRPSMGSCGNIIKQISVEESMPSCLKTYAEPSAPLRNRLLTKLHTLKSASTESLESVGRKYIRAQDEQSTATNKVHKQASSSEKRTKQNLNSSVKSVKGPISKVPQSVRQALGQNNGRVIKVTTIKKSNSTCSAKNGSTKPVYRA